jgi:hypothetical protein
VTEAAKTAFMEHIEMEKKSERDELIDDFTDVMIKHDQKYGHSKEGYNLITRTLFHNLIVAAGSSNLTVEEYKKLLDESISGFNHIKELESRFHRIKQTRRQ